MARWPRLTFTDSFRHFLTHGLDMVTPRSGTWPWAMGLGCQRRGWIVPARLGDLAILVFYVLRW